MNPVGGESINSDWKVERKVRRRRERTLPPGLRADVRRVRRDDLAQEIIDLIDARLHLEARRDLPSEDSRVRVEVIPVLVRKLLKALDCNPEFRGFIRNEINKLLRTHHFTKVDPKAAEIRPALRPCPRPTCGLLAVRSSIGLGTASFLEAEPEEWCQYVVMCSLRRVQPHDLDGDTALDDEALSLFVFGAGPGGIARTVTALELPVHVRVSEYDYVLEPPTAMPCVSGPRGLGEGKYDVVAVVLPSPSIGHASNQRRIYKHDRALEHDLSTLGPQKWLAHVECWVAVLPDLMTAAGEVFMLVPASVRCGSGYQRHAGLLESVLRATRSAGLEVVEQLQVVEVEPVNQPFVGRNRPERWSLRLRLHSSSSATEVGDA